MSYVIVKYVPSWMPGAGFHETARKSKTLADYVRDAPFAVLKDAMVTSAFLSSGEHFHDYIVNVGKRNSETVIRLLRPAERRQKSRYLSSGAGNQRGSWYCVCR